MVAPGASEPAGQVTGPAVGSVTVGLVRVVVPVLVRSKVQVIVSPRSVLPSPFTSVIEATFFTSFRAELCTTGVEVDEGPESTGLPEGSSAEAVAVLFTAPASTPACVITYALAAQVIVAPGTRLPAA